MLLNVINTIENIYLYIPISNIIENKIKRYSNK